MVVLPDAEAEAVVKVPVPLAKVMEAVAPVTVFAPVKL